MALLYIAAGVNHFLHPDLYRRIMPPWLPAHDLLIYGSGVFEIILGVLLLYPPTRRVAAWGIVCLLIVVFPANVQMFLDYRAAHHPQLWLAVARLPLQLVLVWWALQYTKRVKRGLHPG